MPCSIVNWIVDFLSNCSQQIELAGGCLTEWVPILSRVPQGTKFGPWLFILMMNNLTIHSPFLWKFVDDTTDLGLFYSTCVGSDALLQYLINEPVHIKKRALLIIMPGLSYSDTCKFVDITTTVVHHHQLCSIFFNTINSKKIIISPTYCCLKRSQV